MRNDLLHETARSRYLQQLPYRRCRNAPAPLTLCYFVADLHAAALGSIPESTSAKDGTARNNQEGSAPIG